MNSENEKLEMDESMKAVSDFANACYSKGCKDTLIGVAIGAGLAFFGFISKAIYEEYKSCKHQKELKESIKEFCGFVKEEES